MSQYNSIGQDWQDACRGVLSAHIARHPLMQVQDVYKLTHQASLGSEHATPTETAARAWLESELASLPAGPEEPLLDPISPDGEIERVHLRPFLRASLDPEQLLAAFLRTAREYTGSVELLMRYGEEAAQMALEGRLPFRAEEISRFFKDMERRGFPPAHHSPVYQALYHPAYRVVCRRFLGSLAPETRD